ncbi:hypothetical protein ISCGN_016659 [Ixodes scapularis]
MLKHTNQSVCSACPEAAHETGVLSSHSSAHLRIFFNYSKEKEKKKKRLIMAVLNAVSRVTVIVINAFQIKVAVNFHDLESQVEKKEQHPDQLYWEVYSCSYSKHFA